MIPREVINHQQFFQVCLIVLVVSLLGRMKSWVAGLRQVRRDGARHIPHPLPWYPANFQCESKDTTQRPFWGWQWGLPLDSHEICKKNKFVDLCFSQKPLGKKPSSSLRIQHPLPSTIALVRGKSLGHLGHTWILNHECHWDDTRRTPTSYKWSLTPMSRVITPVIHLFSAI